MPSQKGRNVGVTGLVDLTGTPKFTVRVYSLKKSLAVSEVPLDGRGTGRWSKSRAFRPGGTLALRGEVLVKGFPLPDDFRGQEGTVVLQVHKTRTVTVSIRVVAADFSTVEGEQDLWDVGLVCTILANPTFAGFDGTQATATDPAPEDTELFAGLTKTYDPNNLVTSATRQWYTWPLASTDASERQKLADLVATATVQSFSAAKVKFARLEPGRHYDAGVITVQLSLTDTVEDVVNPITQTTRDENLLTSNATSAAVNGAPPLPGDEFVEREGTVRELHDNALLSTKNYGLLDTKESVEFPQSPRQQDPRAELVQEERVCMVTASGTPPTTPTPTTTTLVLRAVERVRINRYRWQHTFVFAPRDSKQDITFPGSPRGDDPSDLNDAEQVTTVTDTATPSVPTPVNTALKHRRTTSVQLTDSGKWQHVYEFARRNTEDDVEMDGSSVADDPADLTEQTEVTTVSASGTPPASAAPAGLVARRVTTRQLHDTRWAHTWLYARRNTEDDIEMDLSSIEDDPSNLTDETRITEVQPLVTPLAPSTPVGLKLRRTTTKQLHASKWQHTFHYALRTTEDDIEFDLSPIDDDPSDLQDETTITEVQGSVTPSAPGTPSGLKLRKTTTLKLTDTKWRHSFHYARRTTEDDAEMGASSTTDDPSDLADVQVIGVVHSNVSPAGVLPATPSGLKLRDTETKQLHDSRWLHVFTFARTNREDDVEMPSSRTDDDPSNLVDEQVVCIVTANATEADPGAPTGLGLRRYSKVQLHDTRWKHLFEYARRTTEEDYTVGRWETLLDAGALKSSGVVVQVTSSATPPATPAVPVSGAKLVGTRSEQIHARAVGGDTGKWAHYFLYGPRTSEEDVTLPNTITRLDPAKIEDRDTYTEVTASATPAASPTSARSAQLPHVATETEKLKDNKWRHTYHFGRRTSEEEIEQEGSPIDDDPKDLHDETRVLQVTNTATPLTGAPLTAITPAGLKHRRTMSVQRTTATAGVVEAALWRHTYVFARNNTEDDVLYPLNVTSVDPQGLASEQQKATLDGIAPTLDAGYSLRETATKTLVTGKTLNVVKGGIRSTKDDIEYPGTVARYSPTAQNVNQTATVLADTGSSMVALASAYGVTRKADPTFDWCEFERLTVDKVKRTIKETSDAEIIRAVSYGGKQAVMCIAGAGVYVWLAKKLLRGTSGGVTLYSALCLPQSLHVANIRFTLRRRVVQQANGPLPIYTQYVGKSNAANFLGLPAFTTAFEGAEPVANIKVPAPRIVEVDLHFRFSSIGIFDDTGAIPGWSTDTYDLDDVSDRSWVLASKFNWPASPATPEDFSVFLPAP